MQEFVLVYPEYIDRQEQVLLILKDKPDFQKGKYNLVGGKVEPGEKPEDAAIRELMEEAGLEGEDPQLYGIVTGDWGKIYCYKISIDTYDLNPGENETEPVSWHRIDELLSYENLMPNLRIMVPLFYFDCDDWTLGE